MQKKPSQKEEFLKAFADHSDAVFRYIFFRIGDRERAVDLTQDVFMKTWGYIDGGNTIDAMRAFLYRTAGNLVIDEYRKRKSTSSLDSLLEEGGWEPSRDDSQSVMDYIDGTEALALLAQLPEPYGEVIFMRFVEELSLSEISTITGQTENTIAVQVHRGLAKLQKLWNHEQ